MKKQYMLVQQVDYVEFIRTVEGYLNEGWKPLGGVATAAYSKLWYLQALIKEEE